MYCEGRRRHQSRQSGRAEDGGSVLIGWKIEQAKGSKGMSVQTMSSKEEQMRINHNIAALNTQAVDHEHHSPARLLRSCRQVLGSTRLATMRSRCDKREDERADTWSGPGLEERRTAFRSFRRPRSAQRNTRNAPENENWLCRRTTGQTQEDSRRFRTDWRQLQAESRSWQRGPSSTNRTSLMGHLALRINAMRTSTSTLFRVVYDGAAVADGYT